jgi:hypothetical protein
LLATDPEREQPFASMIPEPATLALLAGALIVFSLLRRRLG